MLAASFAGACCSAACFWSTSRIASWSAWATSLFSMTDVTKCTRCQIRSLRCSGASPMAVLGSLLDGIGVPLMPE